MPVQTLINVSVKCEYALRAVLDLSLAPGGQPVRIADIASRQKIPQKFLENHPRRPQKAGFSRIPPGAPRAATCWPNQPKPSPSDRCCGAWRAGRIGRAALEDAGPLDEFWATVDAAVAAVIDRKTFAELGRDWLERQSRFEPNWEI